MSFNKIYHFIICFPFIPFFYVHLFKFLPSFWLIKSFLSIHFPPLLTCQIHIILLFKIWRLQYESFICWSLKQLVHLFLPRWLKINFEFFNSLFPEVDAFYASVKPSWHLTFPCMLIHLTTPSICDPDWGLLWIISSEQTRNTGKSKAPWVTHQPINSWLELVGKSLSFFAPIVDLTLRCTFFFVPEFTN